MWRSSVVATMAVTSLLLSLTECSASNGVISSPFASATLSEPTELSRSSDYFHSYENLPVLVYGDGKLAVDEAGNSVDVANLGGAGEPVYASRPATPWQDLAPIEGFGPYNDPRIELPDGRFIVRGRWDADAPMPASWQRNPSFLFPDDPVRPVEYYERRPVRLFVFDPASGDLTPVSHWPATTSYSSNHSIGTGPNYVLEALVLAGGRTVAYTVGFSFAAYDKVNGLYLAPIPPASAD